MLDMTGLDDGFPVIGEIPKCSDIHYDGWDFWHSFWWIFVGFVKTVPEPALVYYLEIHYASYDELW